MRSPHPLLSAAVLALCAACASSGPTRSLEWWERHPPIPDVDTSGGADGIVPVPEGAHRALRETFAKYTRLVATNGRPIHFLAQAGVPDAMLLRARELMRFFLTDAPGTRFGADKSEVANAMADRWATLVLFETQEDSMRAQFGELPEIPLFYQDLYAEECVVEGSDDYLENGRRDGMLEAVFHLVQGAGIRWALPKYHDAIEEAARTAVREGRWQTNLDWVLEGSSAFQYVTSVLEVYYGIWAHDPHGDGRSFGGEYRYVDRDAQRQGDPRGVELIEMFLPETLDLDCRVDPAFEGVFLLRESADTPYTLKSRYLTEVRLTGDHDSGLIGNALDDRLGGNAGDNRIDGGGGHDAVRFRGPREEYEVTLGDVEVTVRDRVEGRDGCDVLTEIACLEFADGVVALDGECEEPAEPALSGPLTERDPDRPTARYAFDPEAHVAAVAAEVLACFDTDGDGAAALDEVSGDLRSLVRLADVDRDSRATREELVGAVRAVLSGQVQLTLDPLREVQRFFVRYDLDRDGRVVPEELPPALLDGFEEADANGDGALTPDELVPAYGNRD